MTPLKKQIASDFKSIQKRADIMFKVYSTDMGKMIDEANKEVLATIASVLSMHKESDYKRLLHSNILDGLDRVMKVRYEALVHKLEDYWGEKRNDFDLMARLAMSFVAKKSSPPWVKVSLNLKDGLSKDGEFDPRKGHFNYYFRSMSDAIMKEIQKGFLNEESMNQVMQRVRKMFNRNSKQGVREDSKWDYIKPSLSDVDPESAIQYKLSGPVDIAEGVYTLEDVERFQLQQQRVMQWEGRQYRPWFSDELKANNRFLRGLEELLMSDALDQIHSGMMQIGPEEFGIDDMIWEATRPGTCDCCDSRDGMTMKEIKAKMKDEYKDRVPPLHLHCRCMLIPKIKDDWADSKLKDGGIEWDSNDGKIYKASKLEKQYNIKDMTFDEYLANIGGQ